MQVLGCRVSDAVIASWEMRLVLEREPIFVTPSASRWLPAGTIKLTGVELGQNFALAPLDLWDTYGFYTMDRKGLEVAFLTPAEFWELPEAGRQELMALQAERGRGQIYTDSWLRKLEISLPSAGRDRFAQPDGSRFALRHDAWWALTPAERRRWLHQFVSQDRISCLSGDLDEDGWARLTEQHGPQIRLLAGTFAPHSGPNCLGTVLAAATRSPHLALSIAGHWLHPEVFLRGLAERGYQATDLPAEADAMPAGAVINFVDESGRVQHAAYYLGDGLVLNKDAQSWFTPRQILRLPDFLHAWSEDGLAHQIYVRS